MPVILKNQTSKKILHYSIFLSSFLFLISCKYTTEVTVKDRYKLTRTIQKSGKMSNSQLTVKDTVENYTILKRKEQTKQKGGATYVAKRITVSYTKEHKKLAKIRMQNRRQKIQQIRTIYYLKNHNSNTLQELEKVNRILFDSDIK